MSRALLAIATMLSIAVSGAACARLASPRIHDISTDTDDPPAFVDVLPLRASAKNAATYGGSRVAAQQRKAYPDIVPVDLAIAPSLAFARSRAVASAMGWAPVSADSSAGRIEATATTRLLRFKDDVVIRIRPRDGGARVDVRSVSRVGRGDLGTNAERVRDFIGRLRSAVAETQ